MCKAWEDQMAYCEEQGREKGGAIVIAEMVFDGDITYDRGSKKIEDKGLSMEIFESKLRELGYVPN